MIRLSRSKIQNLAANEAVFQRGLAYFKDKRVIHAACSKNKKLYTFTVRDSVLDELEKIAAKIRKDCMPGRFKTLEILQSL